MKRTLAILLSLLMLLSLMVGCASEPATTPDAPATTTPAETPADKPADEPADQPTDAPADESTDAPAEEPTPEVVVNEGDNAESFTSFDYDYFPIAETTEITFWKSYENQYTNNDINHHSILQWMEDKTNVHVDFETCSSADAATKFNLMLTSGDLCDVINNFTGYYTSTSTHAVEEGLIFDMTDKVAEWMPNYNNLLKSSKQATQEAKTDEGRMPVIWTLGSMLGTPAAEPIWYGLMYRQDWADEQGLSTPETIDEWDSFLRACQSAYGSEATLSIPNTVWDMVGTWLTAYGAYDAFYVRDGKVNFGPLTDEYKQAVQQMATWWADGLIDRDFTSVVWMGNTEKMQTGEVAAMPGIWGISGTQMKDVGQVDVDKWNLTPAPSPVLNKGDTPKTTYTLRCIIKESTALDAECENIELAARWLDQWFCYETCVREFIGVEGETFIFDDNGDYQYMEGVGVYENNPINLNDYGLVTASWGLYDFYNFDLSNQASNYHDSVHVWDTASTDEVMPSGMTLNAEEAEEYSSTYNDIQTFVSENLAKFVMGLSPMSEYDNFVKTLNEGYDTARCIELQQAAYDRYIAR